MRFIKLLEKIINLIKEESKKTPKNPFSNSMNQNISFDNISDLLDIINNKSMKLEAKTSTIHVWVEKINPEEYEKCIKKKTYQNSFNRYI